MHPGLVRGAAIAPALLLLSSAALGQVTFTDATASVGINFTCLYGGSLDMDSDIPETPASKLEIIQRNMGNGAAVADYDNDGDLDLFLLAQLGFRSRLYRNDLDQGTFTDVTIASGLVSTGLSRVAHFVDLDNDGWRDLVLVNDLRSCGTEPPSAIMRNNGDGTFTDVSAGSGFDPRGHITGGVGLVDYDQDGLVDVYVCRWTALQTAGFRWLDDYNRLYRNLGGFQFQDVTRSMGLGQLATNSFSPIFADFDLDGDSDLFVPVDAHADVYYEFSDLLTDGEFQDESQDTGVVHVGTDMGVAPCDFDDDGDIDLFVTNVTDPLGGFGGNTLLVNQIIPTGIMAFLDEAAPRGVLDTGWGWGTEWIDVENDGDRDLYAVNGFDEFIVDSTLYSPGTKAGLLDRPGDLFLNDGTGFFTNVVGTGATVVGDARTTIAFDYDRDGDQDLLVTHTNEPTILLRNDTPSSNHWVDVELIGGGPINRDAIGARITLDVGGKLYHHEVIGGGSYMAGRPLEAHFGLGAAALIDQVLVLWPDGTSFSAEDVPADQLLVIEYGVGFVLDDFGLEPDPPTPARVGLGGLRPGEVTPGSLPPGLVLPLGTGH